MRYPLAILAVTAAKHHHHPVNWEAVTAVATMVMAVATMVTAIAALLSGITAILVSVFTPWIGHARARLEMLSEKLEKLYGLVKDEEKTVLETMSHYASNIPARSDAADELKKPAEDFRKFQEGNLETAVLVELFFRGTIRASWNRCFRARDQFVVCWYNLYNHGIEPARLQTLTTVQHQVWECYRVLQRDIRVEAQALGDRLTPLAIIRTSLRDLRTDLRNFAGSPDHPTPPR